MVDYFYIHSLDLILFFFSLFSAFVHAALWSGEGERGGRKGIKRVPSFVKRTETRFF